MYLTFYTSEKTLSDKTERLITNALSTEIELLVPLLPINFNSAGNSNNNSCNSEIKIKSEQMKSYLHLKQNYLRLSSKEIEDIIMVDELSDTRINMAQNLLKAQFPLLNGLKSTLLQGKQQTFTEDEVNNKLQIIHCLERHHWIVATSVKCASGQVYFVDSLGYIQYLDPGLDWTGLPEVQPRNWCQNTWVLVRKIYSLSTALEPHP